LLAFDAIVVFTVKPIRGIIIVLLIFVVIF
jgi:hypothetical protein